MRVNDHDGGGGCVTGTVTGYILIYQELLGEEEKRRTEC